MKRYPLFPPNVITWFTIHPCLFAHRAESSPQLLSLFLNFFPCDMMVTIIRLGQICCIDKVFLFFYFVCSTTTDNVPKKTIVQAPWFGWALWRLPQCYKTSQRLQTKPHIVKVIWSLPSYLKRLFCPFLASDGAAPLCFQMSDMVSEHNAVRLLQTKDYFFSIMLFVCMKNCARDLLSYIISFNESNLQGKWIMGKARISAILHPPCSFLYLCLEKPSNRNTIDWTQISCNSTEVNDVMAWMNLAQHQFIF